MVWIKLKLPCLIESEYNDWLRIVVCELFRRGYYNSLSSLLEAISLRFANNYFHKNLKTNFLLEKDFIPPKGYKINWKFIKNVICKIFYLKL